MTTLVNEHEHNVPTRMTVLALAAMWAHRLLADELLALDELLTDLPRDVEISVYAIVQEATLLLGPVYAEMPVRVGDALDLLEETAAEADNFVYAMARGMR